MNVSPDVPSSLEAHSGRSLGRKGLKYIRFGGCGYIHILEEFAIFFVSMTTGYQFVNLIIHFSLHLIEEKKRGGREVGQLSLLVQRRQLTLLKLQLALCSHSMMSTTRGRETRRSSEEGEQSESVRREQETVGSLTSVFDE